MGMFAQAIVQTALTDEQDRKLRMERAWAAYYGRAPDTLKQKPGQPNDNVKINKARVIVDKGVSFLFGDDLSFKLAEDEATETPEADDTPKPAQVWLDKCWEYNRQAAKLHKLALNGGVCGHAFIKIVQPAGSLFPRLVILDPATVEVSWEPDDIECVVDYKIEYTAIDPISRKPINYRQRVEQRGDGWVSIDQQSDPDSTVWRTIATTVWPHPYPPIVDCQNLPAPNEYWGISDIEDDVLALNTAASFTLSNSQRIIRWHASPLTVAKGVAGTTINRDVDGVVMLPNPDASLENLEMQGDLASTIAQYEHICEAIHEVSRIPAISTGTLNNLGQLSGVALAILYQPLVEKTNTKRRFYGDMLTELCRRLLDLAGFGPDNQVTISWPELLPKDPLQERQTYLLEDQMGVVSKETIAERLGHDWDTELARMAAEHAQAVKDAQALMPPAQPGQPSGNPAQTMPQPQNLGSRQDVGGKAL